MPAIYQRCLLLALSILIAACVRNEVVASAEPQPPTTTDSAIPTTAATDRRTEVVGIPSLRDDQSEDVVEPGRYVVLGPGFPGGYRAGGWPAAVIVTVPEGWSSASRQRGGGLYSAIFRLDMAAVFILVGNP